MSLADELARLAAAYHTGNRLSLIFAYDGTLVPLVTHPSLALCPLSTRRLLAELSELPRIDVGIISGRAIDDLKAMVRLPNLVYSGTCGLELEAPSVFFIHPLVQRFRPFLNAAADSLGDIVRHYQGAWVEDKPFGLTVHYRNVSRADVPLLRLCLEQALIQYEGLLTATDGSMAVEVLPAVEWRKAEALRLILHLQDGPALPLYAGNDDNDAQALQIAADLQGVALGIGPSAPATALHRLPDVPSLIEQLGEFLLTLSALNQSSSKGSQPAV